VADYEQAAREFVREVDAEAARLIQLGVPPWDAIIQARQRVEKARRDKAAQTHVG
jgi:hypothetical protein